MPVAEITVVFAFLSVIVVVGLLAALSRQVRQLRHEVRALTRATLRRSEGAPRTSGHLPRGAGQRPTGIDFGDDPGSRQFIVDDAEQHMTALFNRLDRQQDDR